MNEAKLIPASRSDPDAIQRTITNIQSFREYLRIAEDKTIMLAKLMDNIQNDILFLLLKI